MLDDGAVHVDDVQSAVRPSFQIDRARTTRSREAKNSAPSFGVEVASNVTPFGRIDFAMDEVAGRLADEDVAVNTPRQRIAAIDLHAAGGRELAGVQVRRRPRSRRWERRRESVAALATSCDTVGDGDERVLLEVAVFEHDVHRRVAIGADEAVAVVVEREAELAVAGRRLRIRAVSGSKRKSIPLIGDGFVCWMRRVDDRAAAQAVGDVDVVVESEPRMIGAQLLVLLGETGVPGFAARRPCRRRRCLSGRRPCRPA